MRHSFGGFDPAMIVERMQRAGQQIIARANRLNRATEWKEIVDAAHLAKCVVQHHHHNRAYRACECLFCLFRSPGNFWGVRNCLDQVSKARRAREYFLESWRWLDLELVSPQTYETPWARVSRIRAQWKHDVWKIFDGGTMIPRDVVEEMLSYL